MSKSPFLLIILINMLLALTGCAVGPDYVRPEVLVPAQFKEAPDGWKYAQPQDGFNRGEWWLVFNDPKLNTFISQLNQRNQSLIAAQAQYEQALALVGEARAAFFPTLAAALSVTRMKNSSLASPSFSTTLSSNNTQHPFTQYYGALTASWEPDIWGAVRRNVEAAVANAQSFQAFVGATQLSLQASLAQFYFELRGLDGDQVVLNKTVDSYEKLYKIVHNRYEAGIASRLDLATAQSQLEAAKALALDNGILRAQYEHAIAVLTGQPPIMIAIEENNANYEPPTIPLAVPSSLLERRPDIAQAERLVAQANAKIGVAISAYFPVLTLTGTGGYESFLFSKLFTQPAQFWSLGSQLAATLFDGGLRSAQVAFARANYDQTVANYRQIVLAAFQDVEDNLVALRILNQEEMVQKQAVASAQLAVDLVLNGYRAGTSQLSDVITAEITLYTAKKALNDVAYRRMTSAVGLIKALGGGWPSPFSPGEKAASCLALANLNPCNPLNARSTIGELYALSVPF